MTVAVDTGLEGRLLRDKTTVGTHSSVQRGPLATQPQSQQGSLLLSPQRQIPDPWEIITWKPKVQGWLACGGPQNSRRLSILPLKIDAANKTGGGGDTPARRLLSASREDEVHSVFSLL